MNNTRILLLLIIIIAAILRFCALGNVPISPDWDEVSFGYNAYSILHTGKDEYGKVLPVVLESFGDYKPALYTYLIIPFIALFDLTPEAVRLPSTIFGTLTVLTTYFLVNELFKRKSLALFSSFLLAISPWHIQFSRVAFESNIGVAFNVLFVLLFIKGLKKYWLLFPASFFAALSIYTYQSEKVFVPLLGIGLVVVYHKAFFSIPRKYIMTAFTVLFVVLLPMMLFILTNDHALSRAKSTSIFSYHPNSLQKTVTRIADDKTVQDNIGLLLDNRRVSYARQIFSGYISHFDFNWLFITGDLNRHHAPEMGLLYLWELPFLLIGVYQLLRKNVDIRAKNIIFLWFLIAPIPASVTFDVPHAFRTYNFLPIFQIFTAIGLVEVYEFIKPFKKNLRFFIITIILLPILFNIFYYLDQYFVQQNYFYAKDWQYGYASLVPKVEELKNNYSHVVISNKAPMDQSYIFFLFYLKYQPALYQNKISVNTDHNFDKYEFRPINWNNDKNQINTLFVGFHNEFPDSTPTKAVIKYPDGSPGMEIISKQ